ncbi:MAG: nitroreductase family deazaflavin-dependent oxidoreductase, partial [Solirubrobacteraceae bacterium]
FRANGGVVGGMFADMPLLLLHHVGAKSGKDRINPLAYQEDHGRYVIFASKGGAPVNPGWYYNLKAHPETTIEIGTDSLDVTAAEATGEERERLFSEQVRRAPTFREYQEKAGREIPVVVLSPGAGG